jgi:hypothetical protein
VALEEDRPPTDDCAPQASTRTGGIDKSSSSLRRAVLGDLVIGANRSQVSQVRRLHGRENGRIVTLSTNWWEVQRTSDFHQTNVRQLPATCGV